MLDEFSKMMDRFFLYLWYDVPVILFCFLGIDGVGKFNFVPFSTNATNLDRKSVRTPGTQRGCVGKVSVVVLI